MTRTARIHPTLAVAVLAALALTGCAGDAEPGATSSADGGASSSSSAEPSAEATSEPTAEPTAEAPAAEPAVEASTGDNTIAAPSDGATVAGPAVDVTGMGTAYEATLLWRVVGAGTDDVVAEDFTTAGANGEVGPYAFSVDLTPGAYTLEVWEPGTSDGGEDAEGSEGDGSNRRGLVTSTFTVS